MSKTILISSHILSELSEMCNSIGIIDNGRIVIDGRVDDIMRRLTGKTIVKIRILGSIEKAVNILKEQPAITEIVQEGEILETAYEGKDEDLWKILQVLVNQEIPIISFGKADGNLEKIFMEVTKSE